MLDSRPPLPLRFSLLNKVANYVQARRLPSALLDEETLTQAAIKETGLTDFGAPYYREGLLTLIESAEKDANFHFVGRIAFHALIVNFLANRLLLAEARKRTPEVFQRPLIPPIIILGMPRTGTTFLHRMLAVDPAHRGVPMWELMHPLRNGTPDRRRKIVGRRSRFRRSLNPSLDRIHYTRVDEPEECILLQGTTFASAFFFLSAPVYSYADWYTSHDHLKAYQEYRLLLQVLQAVEPERRLTLKAPSHTATLAALLHTIPDALIIQIHRDPVTSCNSVMSLIYSSWAIVSEKIDVPRMAETIISTYEEVARASLTFHETNPDIIYNVYYDRLVADPIGTVRSIYDHFGLAWSGAYEEQLKAYVRENPQNKRGRHHYCSNDFGLTDDTIARRFTEYSERFGFTDQHVILGGRRLTH